MSRIMFSYTWISMYVLVKLGIYSVPSCSRWANFWISDHTICPNLYPSSLS